MAIHCIMERMVERFGAPEMVELSLKKKLADFPTLIYKDHSKLYDSVDLIFEIEGNKADPKFGLLLSRWGSLWILENVGLVMQFSTVIITRCISLHSTNPSISSGYKAKFATTLAAPTTQSTLSHCHQHWELYGNPRKQKNWTLHGRPMSVSLPSLPTSTQGALFKKNIQAKTGLLPNYEAFLQKTIIQRKEILKKSRLCFRYLKHWH